VRNLRTRLTITLTLPYKRKKKKGRGRDHNSSSLYYGENKTREEKGKKDLALLQPLHLNLSSEKGERKKVSLIWSKFQNEDPQEEKKKGKEKKCDFHIAFPEQSEGEEGEGQSFSS